MSRFNKKIIILFLMLGLNYAGLLAVGQTLAYFNDEEISSENIFSAGVLDFRLNSLADFSPEVTPTQNSVRDISVIKDGILDFEYNLQTEDETGDLCDNLNLTVFRNGADIGYTGTLKDFTYNAGQFSSPDDWQFTASLIGNDPSLENKTCDFDFVFDGSQISGAGFSDQEVISNTIISGQWVIPPPPPMPDLCLKINEVYYDPDSQHGDADDEWIELYNACDHTINLKNWYLMDNNATETIHNSYDVNAGQFVVIAANASTWNQYWQLIPENAVKIALGGQKMFKGLNNDGDRIFLYDNQNNEIDAVSWGTDKSAFVPQVPDVEKGHSIARKIKGVDTNTADDWEDLTNPNPGTNPNLILSEETPQAELEQGGLAEEELTEEPAEEEPAIIEEPADNPSDNQAGEEPPEDEPTDENNENI